MRKNLFFVIIMLSCLCANAQEEGDTLVSLAKVNFEGLADIPQWCSFADGETGVTLEIVDDGIAITNPHVQDQGWQPQVTVIGDNLILEEGHDYIVRLTLKVPSDGTYWLCMGNWDTRFFSQVAATARDGFQIIDVEYPEYKGRAVNAFVMLGLGWVVGTTILKEVEVLEKTSAAGIQSAKSVKDADEVIYNLAGQGVIASYKGIVIKNGKKLLVK